MEITLKPGEKAKIASFEMELTDITKKRLPVNPETGEGGDEELRLTLRFTKGGKSVEKTFYYPGQAEEEFDGHTITVVKADNFQEWILFRVELIKDGGLDG